MKHKVILNTSLVLLLFAAAPAAMAETRSSCEGAVECTVKGALKFGKKVATPVIIFGGAAANAGEKYLEGGSAGEVIAAGAAGAGENVAEAISETIEDTATVTKAVFKVIGNTYEWLSK